MVRRHGNILRQAQEEENSNGLRMRESSNGLSEHFAKKELPALPEKCVR